SVNEPAPLRPASQSKPPPTLLPGLIAVIGFLPKRTVRPLRLVAKPAAPPRGLKEKTLSMPLLALVPAWTIVLPEPAPWMVGPAGAGSGLLAQPLRGRRDKSAQRVDRGHEGAFQG